MTTTVLNPNEIVLPNSQPFMSNLKQELLALGIKARVAINVDDEEAVLLLSYRSADDNFIAAFYNKILGEQRKILLDINDIDRDFTTHPIILGEAKTLSEILQLCIDAHRVFIRQTNKLKKYLITANENDTLSKELQALLPFCELKTEIN